MPIKLDIRKDLRYIEGFKQGYEEGLTEVLSKVVRCLLKNTNMSCEQIASELEYNIDLVERVKNEMQLQK